MILMTNPPKMVYDDSGQLVEVILSAKDYRAYLRALASESDWETLPKFLQDAIDRMLIDDVRHEKDMAVDLEDVLAEELLAA
ncbi:MAG: hypothetical protein HF973_02440 [Chloroflexi bacterium]|nr:hypothetical protein [Chloroflexota bacterium]